MKRIIAGLLTALMLLTLVAACSPKNKLIGTWTYTDKANGIVISYEFKTNGKVVYTLNMNGQESIHVFNYETEGDLVIINGDVTRIQIEGDTMFATFNGVTSELHRN